MCQCGFINCTTGVQDVNIGEDCTCVRKGGIWELSVRATQFCCEPKIALIKNKAYFKNIDISAYIGSSKKNFFAYFSFELYFIPSSGKVYNQHVMFLFSPLEGIFR